MKALVVFTYISNTDNYETRVNNVFINFKGDLATQKEIETIENELSTIYPFMTEPRVVNIIKLEG